VGFGSYPAVFRLLAAALVIAGLGVVVAGAGVRRRA
jgi:hypothetical protein